MINLEKDVKLKVLKEEYITIDYIEWMNDYEVTRFTEQRYNKHTSNSISEFIMEKSKSKTDKLFGIFVYKKHIGNILISSIDKNNSSCNLSYLIGKKEFWGLGIGGYVISEALNIIFNKLKLVKVSAGCYENNLASIRVLEKNNFLFEGLRKNQVNFEGKMIDVMIYGLFAKNVS